MGAVDLQNAYETDSKAVKSLLRSTIHSAMDPTNTSYNITTIKLDFSNGRLLVGNDPRYIYRSPIMTVETIPIDPTYDSERDVSIASEIIEGGTRKYAGGESIAAAAAVGCKRSLETNSSMLNAIADGESTVTAYDYYQAYLKANDLSEGEYPFIPNENDASHISKEDIVKWIEDGERAITTSVPQKAAREVTSMNSFSTLKSVSSTTTTFGKSNYGIREIADEHVDDNDTLEDVTSLASTIESSENDFSETPIIRTPYPN